MSGSRILGGCALAALLLGGCSRMSMMPLHDEIENPGHAWRSAKGQPITGFITSDGAYHRFHGWVKLEGDSLVLHGPAPVNKHGEPSRRIATTEVTTLFGEEVDTGKVVGFSLTVLATLALVALVASLAAGGGPAY